MKKKVYGYARVSTIKQELNRQIDSIKSAFPEAIIITESYTGTTINRPAWDKLMISVNRDLEKDIHVTIVFDEVSRLARNSKEGFDLYKELFNKNVNLVFLKEKHLDSSVFAEKVKNAEELNTGKDYMNEGMRIILLGIAEEQIKIAFEQAESEVKHLHKRTSEGVKQAQKRYYEEEALGVPHKKLLPGRQTGTKINTKKSIEAKEIIRKHSKDFGGTLSDAEVIKLASISRNSFYKYKRELKQE